MGRKGDGVRRKGRWGWEGGRMGRRENGEGKMEDGKEGSHQTCGLLMIQCVPTCWHWISYARSNVTIARSNVTIAFNGYIWSSVWNFHTRTVINKCPAKIINCQTNIAMKWHNVRSKVKSYNKHWHVHKNICNGALRGVAMECTMWMRPRYIYLKPTFGLTMILPNTVKMQAKPRGVHTVMRTTPAMETREYRRGTWSSQVEGDWKGGSCHGNAMVEESKTWWGVVCRGGNKNWPLSRQFSEHCQFWHGLVSHFLILIYF